MSPGPGPQVASCVVIGLVALLSPAPQREASAQPRRYVVSSAKSRLVARLFKAGLGSRLAHDHLIVPGRLEGTIDLDPARPDRARIAITVDARSLRADPPALRRRYGLPPIDAGDVAKIQRNLHAIDQLYTATFPAIRFVSRRVEPLGADRYRVRGVLTLRGVSRRVSLTVRARLSGGVLKGSGRLSMLQSGFGYKPYSAALGLVRVADRAGVDIYIEARPGRSRRAAATPARAW